MKGEIQLQREIKRIEDNSAVAFIVDTPDGLLGELPWHSTDELLGVHQAASSVGRTVDVLFEDDEGNVRLKFPEK